MKNLKDKILEKLIINKDSKLKKYYPKTKDELEKLIKNLIKERGNEANLNDIDTSEITDMSYLFAKYDENNHDRDKCFSDFNGDISNWNVSNVKNMSHIFYHSDFNQDISNWDVSNVENMYAMFIYSKFNGDISNWDVSNVTDMSVMFAYSKFNGDISKWDVSKVEEMSSMFDKSQFNGDISKWNVSNVENINDMFYNSKFNQNINNWKIRKSKCRSRMKNVFDNSPLEKNPPQWYK